MAANKAVDAYEMSQQLVAAETEDLSRGSAWRCPQLRKMYKLHASPLMGTPRDPFTLPVGQTRHKSWHVETVWTFIQRLEVGDSLARLGKFIRFIFERKHRDTRVGDTLGIFHVSGLIGGLQIVKDAVI